MKIKLERSGGFAAITTTYSVDDKSVTPAEGRQLEELLEKTRFFDMPSKSPSTRRGADYYTYRITVEKERGKHTVTATDITMPEGLRHIIEFIMHIQKQRLQK